MKKHEKRGKNCLRGQSLNDTSRVLHLSYKGTKKNHVFCVHVSANGIKRQKRMKCISDTYHDI